LWKALTANDKQVPAAQARKQLNNHCCLLGFGQTLNSESLGWCASSNPNSSWRWRQLSAIEWVLSTRTSIRV